MGTTGSYNPPGGGATITVVPIAGDTTAVVDTLYLCDSTGGAFTVTLPPAASASGHEVIVKQVAGVDDVVVEGDKAEAIDGDLSQTVGGAWNALAVRSDGTGWFII